MFICEFLHMSIVNGFGVNFFIHFAKVYLYFFRQMNKMIMVLYKFKIIKISSCDRFITINQTYFKLFIISSNRLHFYCIIVLQINQSFKLLRNLIIF